MASGRMLMAGACAVAPPACSSGGIGADPTLPTLGEGAGGKGLALHSRPSSIALRLTAASTFAAKVALLVIQSMGSSRRAQCESKLPSSCV